MVGMRRFIKLVSVCLVIALAVSCFVMQAPIITAGNDVAVWDGSSIIEPAGTGSKNDPYRISNGAELAWMVMSYGGGKYFSLVDDIYLNEVDKINWQTGEVEEGYNVRQWYNRTQAWQTFNGNVNGNGHVIYGLYINDQTQFAEGSGGFGLFPVCGNVTINGLGIDKSYLEGYTMYSIGAFAGYGQGSLQGSMENCYVGADVTIKGKDAGAFVGGGDIASMFTIKNCYSLATLSYTRRGGLVADSWTSEYTFENVYCLDSILTNVVAKATNCYSTKSGTGLTQVAEANMKGRVTDGNSLVLGDAFVATEGFPVLKVFTENPDSTDWNGLAELPAGGDGSSMANAYEISTIGQLAYFVAQGWGNAKLVNDIYINDVDKIDWSTGAILDENYTPNTWFYGTDNGAAYYIGFGGKKAFSGNFDGNGFTIHGLWYSPDFDKITAGLFPGGSSATIRNLQIANSYVVGGRFVGALSSTFSGTVENVVVDNTVTVKQKRNLTTDSFSVGGLIGYSNGVTIKGCASTAKLIGDSHKYGLIGTSWGTKIDASNCFSYGVQPFTTSIGSKTFANAEEANTFYSNLYKVTDVYTDVTSRANTVSYKLGEESASHEVFTFTKLTSDQMKGKSALDNMPAMSKDLWYATDDLPKTKWWAVANGDADLDGIQAMAGDYAAIRKAIIGAGDTGCTDYNRNGKTDICDLVKIWYLTPTYYGSGFTYTLENLASPENYVIVYANGSAEAKSAAEALQKAYKDQGYTVSVVADTAAVSDKEILFGDTNRGLHNDDLADGKYTITVAENKIQVSASTTTPAALKTAVDTITKLSPKGFMVITEGWHEYEGGSVTLATNLTKKQSWPLPSYTDPRERTYTYVWGDEFYGDTLNPNKWVCTTGSSKMSGYSDLTIVSTEEAVKVQNGSLNLTSGQRADGSFFAPASVHTQGTMEYRYGYIEIRAKIPYRTGVWPSFWMQSAATLGGRQNYDYMVEVDMLEVFGHTSDLYCNLHKWYSSAKQEQYGVRNIAAAEDGGIAGTLSSWFGQPVGEEKRTVENPEEWHTYGFAWDANYMCMYVDQKLFRVYDITSAKNVFGSDNVKKTDSDMSGFNDPLYIIFNNHIFTENATWKPHTITGSESTSLPATYEIDYVRLYQGTESNTQLWTKN